MDSHDNGYDDTRKVPLAELLLNVDEESLDVLEAFDHSIKKKVRAAKQAVLEAEAAGEEEVADVPTVPAEGVEVVAPEAAEAASPEAF